MGQKPRLPRSITLTKNVTISIKVRSKNFTPKEWSLYLESFKVKGKQARYKEEFDGLLLGSMDSPLDLTDEVINAETPIKLSLGSHKKTFMLI